MEVKICQSCGREMEHRKKWEKDWENIKYCSQECKKNKKPTKLMEDILSLLSKREQGKTICPSEVLPLELKKNKIEMEKVRRAARLLVHEGKIQILQKSKVVNPQDFKGPIRLKKR